MSTNSSGFYLGLMSGTSCDGLDISLSRFPGDEHIHSEFFPYSNSMRNRIQNMADPSWTGSMQEIANIHFDLSRCYSEFIDNFFADPVIKITKNEIDAIGLHGHTFWHEAPKSTLQLGSPALLNQLTGCRVISDFRTPDVALGGQGAPLLPYYHLYKFQEQDPVLIQNIGGVGNLTYIPSKNNPTDKISAFDTGPGNLLMDQAVGILTNGKMFFDLNGRFASQGEVNDKLLKSWFAKELDYINTSPPKSTGRERYNQNYVNSLLNDAEAEKESIENTLATLTELTILSIVENIKLHLNSKSKNFKKIYVCGGGAKNPVLLNRLDKNTSDEIEIFTTEEKGVDPLFVESRAFALFAWKTVIGESYTLPEVTGASKATYAGQISQSL